MLGAQQHLELAAQARLRLFAHLHHLKAQLLKLVIRSGAGGQLADPAAAPRVPGARRPA